ncbi:unnamed protein product [Musa acuminata subsp. malaccensis]|nr:unnamed protein product [Musa acuminata subsp. malaccensis]
MASAKAAKPVGIMEKSKEAAAMAGEGAPRAPASKKAPKRAGQKPREPKRKAKGGKPAAAKSSKQQ